MLRTFFIFSLLSLLAGNLLAGGNVEGELEPIVLELLEKNVVIFRATSNGCTQPEDFQVSVQGRDLSIRRVKEDRCRRVPYWDRFTIPLSFEPRETQVYLLNPLLLQAN